MAFLNTSVVVNTNTVLSHYITKARVLSTLHNNDKMMQINPIIMSHELLPSSSSISFFNAVPVEYRPPNPAETPVYKVIERVGEDGGSGTWRGGWAKAFIPETVSYQTSMEARDDGMRTITRAPMGVASFTTWVVRDPEQEGGGLRLGKAGVVSSNRMLMRFIQTTINESYEKLARDFVALLEKEYAEENETGPKTDVQTEVTDAPPK